MKICGRFGYALLGLVLVNGWLPAKAYLLQGKMVDRSTLMAQEIFTPRSTQSTSASEDSQAAPPTSEQIKQRLESLREAEVRRKAQETHQRIEIEARLREAEERRWRTYGAKKIKWDEWKLSDDGVRVTRYEVLVETSKGRQVENPRRFDRSLDDLLRDGVVSPREVRIRAQPGSMANRSLVRDACAIGALSSRECAIPSPLGYLGSGPRSTRASIASDAQAIGSPDESLFNLIAVNCSTLRFAIKPKFGSWSTWKLPDGETDDEKLVIHLCSNITLGK